MLWNGISIPLYCLLTLFKMFHSIVYIPNHMEQKMKNWMKWITSYSISLHPLLTNSNNEIYHCIVLHHIPPILTYPQALSESLERKSEEGFEKRKGFDKKNRMIQVERILMDLFLFKNQNFANFGGAKKIVQEEGFGGFS